MKRQAVALLLTLAITLTGIWMERNTMAQEQVPKPPPAKKVPKTTQIHGYTVTEIDETSVGRLFLATVNAL